MTTNRRVAPELSTTHKGDWVNEPEMLTAEAAVALLQEINPGDPEAAHDQADAVLLRCVPAEVYRAYQQLVDSCAWWATA